MMKVQKQINYRERCILLLLEKKINTKKIYLGITAKTKHDEFTFSPKEKDDDNNWKNWITNKNLFEINEIKKMMMIKIHFKTSSVTEISSQEFAKATEKIFTKNENKNNKKKK
jgi:hypothetical protein